MFLVTLNILFGALALSARSAIGTNQHLICKTVNDVFTEELTNSYSSATRHVLHGPAGKRGQRGVKGEPGIQGLKGEKGLPGSVDPEDVQNVVEDQMRKANRELLERIEALERFVAKINSSMAGFTPQCDNGFVYSKKCYFTIIYETRKVQHEDAGTLCASKGGTLADILNAEHQELSANHIRSETPISGNTDIWLGMLFTPSTTTIVLSNGDRVSEDVTSSVRWWSGYPRSSSHRDKMMIAVNSNTFGYLNIPLTDDLHGVLCSK